MVQGANMAPKREKSEVGVRGGRLCPRCRKDLFLVERGGERLDVCHSCSGIWFDKDELAVVLGKESTVELLVGITKELKGENLLCPNCRETMSTKEVYDVFVDICRECGGIWMDKGETEKIWARDEKTRHPFGIGVEEADPDRFWDMFRKKYREFERLDEA